MVILNIQKSMSTFFLLIHIVAAPAFKNAASGKYFHKVSNHDLKLNKNACHSILFLKCAFLVEKKFPRNTWTFSRAKVHHVELKHLGPHRQNKQMVSYRQVDIEILLDSCGLSLQFAVLLLVIRIFLILHNKTCIWTCWSSTLTTSHGAFHTMLLAAASSSAAICCTIASYDFQKLFWGRQ